jgi:heterodisulfide reductase subunit C
LNKVKSPEDRTFLAEVASVPGGVKIRECIQCGTCTGSCPNANQMDHSPREIIALIRAGLREEVLTSNSMWYCLSCYQCTVRCPRDIKPTDLMHSLECLAVTSEDKRKG